MVKQPRSYDKTYYIVFDIKHHYTIYCTSTDDTANWISDKPIHTYFFSFAVIEKPEPIDGFYFLFSAFILKDIIIA